MAAEHVTLPAADGYPLAGTLHEPEPGTAGGAAVVVHPATGVRRSYYARFAAFLAERGFAVLTYDYRGIGGSRPASLRGFPATMRDWAEQDMTGAVDWLASHRPGDALVAVAHSFGGQGLPLAANAGLLRGVVMVGSQSGSWRDWPAAHRPAVFALWHGVIPGLTSALGYFPSRLLGMGESLPAGVARQWARWGRSPGYLSDDVDAAGRSLADAHRAFRAPVLSLTFSDDVFAPHRAAATLLSWYGSAEKEHRHLRPADLGQRRVGHFGFFRPSTGGVLWPEVADWLSVRAGAASPTS